MIYEMEKELEQFLIAAKTKFKDMFIYDISTYVNNDTLMTLKYHNVSFTIKPKEHIKSETGFPKIIDYDLFLERAKYTLKEEFIDYKFVKESYITFGVPMTVIYKNKSYRRIPSRILKCYRGSEEYEEFRKIASQYDNYEDMNRDYKLIYTKIRERFWFELIEHFKIYNTDWKQEDNIKKLIKKYESENKSFQ